MNKFVYKIWNVTKARNDELETGYGQFGEQSERDLTHTGYGIPHNLG